MRNAMRAALALGLATVAIIATAVGDHALAAEKQADAAARAQVLTRNGIAPGLTFGMRQADALAAARRAFGRAGPREHNDECGEGPMDFVAFGDLQLGFQNGRLVGWSLSGPRPALRTRTGLAIGAPRTALGRAEIDADSSLGPEFEIDGVGGILDERAARVEALWAGLTCQFR